MLRAVVIPEEVRELARSTTAPEGPLRLNKPRAFIAGLPDVEPELRELQEWLIKALSSRKVLFGSLRDHALEKLQALLVVQHHQPAAFALALSEAHGIELVLSALITPCWLHSIARKTYQACLVRNAKPQVHAHLAWLAALETQFEAAPTDTKERLRALAETHRAKLDISLRIALSQLFRDPQWAEADAATLLATQPIPNLIDSYLVSLLPQVEHDETFEALLSLSGPFFFGRSYLNARVLLQSAPERASKRLALLLQKALAAEKTEATVSLVGLLACLHDRVAASAIADAALFAMDTAEAYFLAHPEHRTLLEAHSQGPGNRPQAYQALLLEMDRQSGATRSTLACDLALPAALASPPWTAREQAWAARELTLIADGELVIESPELRARLSRYRSDLSEAELVAKAQHELLGEMEFAALADDTAFAHIERLQTYVLPAALARFGVRAVPALATVLNQRPTKAHTEVLKHVRSPRLAAVAWGFHQDEAWLLDEPMLSALGLIPELFVADAARRFAAELGLLRLCVAGHRAAVEAAAARYGEHAPEVLRILDRDAAQRLPDSLPTLTKALTDCSLPVLVTEQGPLPAWTIPTVGTLLQVSRIWLRHPGLTELREACTQASRDSFAWELYQKTGDPDGIAHLGGDACVRKLDGVLSRKSESMPRAVRFHAYQVLGRVGTPLAIVLLRKHALLSPDAERAQFIESILAEMARVRSCTTIELEDEAFATLDVARALPVLDFGARSFAVSLDEHLLPHLRDHAGHLVSKLPKPNKKDDAHKAASAKAQFDALDLDLDDVRETILTFFERALTSQRIWNLAHFQRAMMDHPLLRQVLRRLVLASGELCFRVAEDKTFADANDALVQLPPSAPISIAHPLRLTEAQLRGFRQVFLDYEIIQPFPQLERGVFRLSAEERASSSLTRFVGQKVESGALSKLIGGGGWQQGTGERLEKRLGSLLFSVRPRHHSARKNSPASDELRELKLSEAEKPALLSTLDEIAASELLRDLETLPRIS